MSEPWAEGRKGVLPARPSAWPWTALCPGSLLWHLHRGQSPGAGTGSLPADPGGALIPMPPTLPGPSPCHPFPLSCVSLPPFPCLSLLSAFMCLFLVSFSFCFRTVVLNCIWSLGLFENLSEATDSLLKQILNCLEFPGSCQGLMASSCLFRNLGSGAQHRTVVHRALPAC